MQGTIPEQLTVQVRLEESSFWATVDEFPGVFATGDTLDELRESLEDGLALYLSEQGTSFIVKLGSLTGTGTVTTAAYAALVPA